MDDGTHFYVDAPSGRWSRGDRLVAVLRFHVGPAHHGPGTREDAHNPWVIGFGLVALVMAVIALIMLPLTI